MKKKLRKKLLKVSLVFILSVALLSSQGLPAFAQSLSTSPSIDWGQYVGDAFNSLTNDWMGRALENVTATRLIGTAETICTYDVIETNEQLRSFVQKSVSATASGSYSGVTADASYTQNLSTEVNINNSALYIILNYRYDAGNLSIYSANFSSYAKSLIDSAQKSSFESIYGNSFVRKANYGGLLSIIYKSEVNSSSTVSKNEVRAALRVKARAIGGASVSASEMSEAEKTLFQTKTSSLCYSTGSSLSENNIAWDRSAVVAKVNEFNTYYNNIKNSGSGDFYVFSRVLAPYWTVPFSGYTDSSKFPEFCDSGKFFASNCTMTPVIEKTTSTEAYGNTTVTWQDNCEFEDGFRVYLKTSSMTLPTLKATTSPNCTSCSLNLPTEVLETGGVVWVVPIKKGINGTCYGNAIIEPIYSVTFYSDMDYGGVAEKFYGEVNIPNFGSQEIGQDKVSSLKISGMYDVTVYADINYQGTSHTYRFSDPLVNNEPIDNDRVSSAVIRRVSRADYEGIYIYEHINYNGKWQKVTTSIDYMTNSPLGNDSVSSVRIVGYHPCVLFDNWVFRWGNSLFCNASIPDLRNTTLGQDTISSISVPNQNERGNWSLNGNGADRGYYGSSPATGTGSLSQISGARDYAVNLTGGYLSVPATKFNNMNSFTISAWIKPASLDQYNVILSKVNPNRDFVLQLFNGKIDAHFTINYNQYYHCISDSTVPLNTWSHVAAVFTGNKWQIYLNGSLIKEASTNGYTPSWTGSVMNIGALDNGGCTFKGGIDEVRVYDRALSPTEINQLYTSSL